MSTPRTTRLVPRGHANTWERGEVVPGPDDSQVRARLYRRGDDHRIDIELHGPRQMTLLKRLEINGTHVASFDLDHESIGNPIEWLSSWARIWMDGYNTAVTRINERLNSPPTYAPGVGVSRRRR